MFQYSDELGLFFTITEKEAQTPDKKGNLPIHNELKTYGSPSVTIGLLNLYPKSAELKNDKGELPLHLAAALDTSMDYEEPNTYKKEVKILIEKLIQIYPEGVKTKDKKGKTPLLRALYLNPIAVQILLHADPQAATIQNEYGWLPLHDAVGYNDSPEIVKLLLNAFPEGAKFKDLDGNIPLHYAQTPNIIKALLDVYPAGAKIKNNERKIPQ